MELRNGDNIAGEVVSIVDGMITVKTSFREAKLPVETLRDVALKPVERERCKRLNGDVRAWLPDGSSIVFRLNAPPRVSSPASSRISAAPPSRPPASAASSSTSKTLNWRHPADQRMVRSKAD